MVRLVIEHGVDMELRDGDGCTPLHLATLRGEAEVAAFLLSQGASVQCVEGDLGKGLVHAGKCQEESLTGARAEAVATKTII